MNGVVIVDKPAGKTSHDVVTIVKKTLGARKAGHTGTLDPLATGVLAVCLNEATKLAQFLSAETKEYQATMLLGTETDTLDIEGKIVAQRDVDVGQGEIEKAMARFMGQIDQKPPRYSAVKFKGQALYKWARKGVLIDSPARKVEIRRLAVEDVTLPYVTFSVSCSAGTYIRSLCADVGRYLNCGACLAGLRRLRSGSFRISAAVAPDDEQALRNRIIPMTDSVSHLPAIPVDKTWVKKLKEGVQPNGELLQGHDISFLVSGDMVRFISEEGGLVAIAMLEQAVQESAPAKEGTVVKVLRIFHDQ